MMEIDEPMTESGNRAEEVLGELVYELEVKTY
jgi:hypothetical protein